MLRYSYPVLLVAVCLRCLEVSGFALNLSLKKNYNPKARHQHPQMAAALDASIYQPAVLTSITTSLSSLPLPDSSLSERPKNGLVSYYRADITGFSLTAARTLLRTATGISLTAVYTSALTLSGAWIRTIMTLFLSIWPTWLRYFVQPLLVLYYAPLLVLRNLAGPNRKTARLSHEHLVDGWKKAVQVADGSTQYWPVHVNSRNELESDMHELDLKEAIAESSFMSMELEEQARIEG